LFRSSSIAALIAQAHERLAGDDTLAALTEFAALDEEDGVELGPAPNERLGVVRCSRRVLFG
jgi:hypothetical protein